MTDRWSITEQERAGALVAQQEQALREARENARLAEEALRRARREVADASGSLGEARKRLDRMELSISKAGIWLGMS